MITVVLQVLHILAGLVVVVEAANKLERCDPLAKGLSVHARLVDGLKALAWFLLALGAGGAIAGPVFLSLGYETSYLGDLMRMEHPTLAEIFVLVGFAVLIVRTRLKEG